MSHGVGRSPARHLETIGCRAHMHGAIMSLYTRGSVATCGGGRRLSIEIPGVVAPLGVVYVGEPVGCPLAASQAASRPAHTQEYVGHSH
jgi:hypothetical protein